MPMVGHIAELGVVIGHEFREGKPSGQLRRDGVAISEDHWRMDR